MQQKLKVNSCWLPKAAICLALVCFLSVRDAQASGLPPIIAVQPLGLGVHKGDTAIFTSTIALSLTPLTIKWYLDGDEVKNAQITNLKVPILGTTITTLTVSHVTPSRGGNYWLKAENGGGEVHSGNALLIILDETLEDILDGVRGITSPFAISTDNISAADTGSADASNLTWSHTTGTGTQGLLVVSVATQSGKPVSSVTYGGAPLTKVCSVTSAAGPHPATTMWYLKAPAAGAANVIVTLSSADTFTANAVTFFGVNQSVPFGSYSTNTGSGFAPSVGVRGTSGELILDSVAVHAATTSALGSGQTKVYTQSTGSSGGDVFGGSSVKAGASTNFTSWSLSGTGAGEWAAASVAINPATLGSAIIASLTTKLNNLGFSSGFSGLAPGTYVVQVSTNMVNWSNIATNFVQDGNIQFSDPTAIYHVNGYYRLITP